eukprot:4536349-Pyramimonas_sp.AAC.1
MEVREESPLAKAVSKLGDEKDSEITSLTRDTYDLTADKNDLQGRVDELEALVEKLESKLNKYREFFREHELDMAMDRSASSSSSD